MSLTRANVEAAIVDRCGAFLTLVGKPTTTAGSNASLNFPIGKAVQALGFAVSDIGAVADADIAQVPGAEANRFLDYVELYVLESVWGNWTAVDIKFGQDAAQYSQVRSDLADRIKLLENRVRKPYGTALGASVAAPLTGGSVKYDPNNRRNPPGGYSPWSVP